ncbi:hypothetical protein CBS101457_004153 [Exobasidium rhododendri]|nr:hypothetical protein CBS101457_004153 [Exobasidium rhododendri]
MSISRSAPPSVEAILQKQKEAASFKPRFLSKAERQSQAREKEEADSKEKIEKAAKEKAERDEFEKKAKIASYAYVNGNGRGRESQHQQSELYEPRERGRGHGRGNAQRIGQDESYRNGQDGRGGERGSVNGQHRASMAGPSQSHSHSHSRSQSQSQSHTLSSSSSNINEEISDANLTEAERELIRNKYMGVQEKSRKKTRKQLNDKKLLFDWDQTEDTSDKLNPVIFDNHVEATAFGAGGRAGMDVAQRQQPTATVTSNGDPLRRGAKSAFAEKHWSEKGLDEMKERDWRIFREDFGIAAKGGHIPKPLRTWKESDIPGTILRAIGEIGYTEPSPIQRQAIPIGLQNRDLIGVAETGSGKTASFVIPMLAYISQLPRLSEANRHLGPYALIIAPTRELAQQIEVETQKFTSSMGYTCVSIVGGRDMNEQAHNLRNGAEIIVATPGRLKDCVERHVLVLSQCLYLVLDEADKSIGLGFADVLDYILDSMPASNLKPDTEEAEDPLTLLKAEGSMTPKYRVTMLYSATMPASVERLAKNYLRRPATITIGNANQAVSTVEQRVEFIQGDDKKKARLMQILSMGLEPPVIVFSTTIQSVDSLSHDIRRAGFNVAVLHSKKSQTQREEALASLRSGECPILVATDLAGRGIDVPDVSAVINYSFPTSFEAYIHRIGRTGRAGKRGIAFTFLESYDEEFFYDLRQELTRSPISTVPRELEKHPASQTRVTRDYKRKRDGEEH